MRWAGKPVMPVHAHRRPHTRRDAVLPERVARNTRRLGPHPLDPRGNAVSNPDPLTPWAAGPAPAGPDHLASPDPGEPAWEWRREYLHEMKD